MPAHARGRIVSVQRRSTKVVARGAEHDPGRGFAVENAHLVNQKTIGSRPGWEAVESRDVLSKHDADNGGHVSGQELHALKANNQMVHSLVPTTETRTRETLLIASIGFELKFTPGSNSVAMPQQFLGCDRRGQADRRNMKGKVPRQGRREYRRTFLRALILHFLASLSWFAFTSPCSSLPNVHLSFILAPPWFPSRFPLFSLCSHRTDLLLCFSIVALAWAHTVCSPISGAQFGSGPLPSGVLRFNHHRFTFPSPFVLPRGTPYSLAFSLFLPLFWFLVSLWSTVFVRPSRFTIFRPALRFVCLACATFWFSPPAPTRSLTSSFRLPFSSMIFLSCAPPWASWSTLLCSPRGFT